MSLVDILPLPEQNSRPLSSLNPVDNLDDDDRQATANDTFLQHLVVKQPTYSHRYSRKSNTNYTSSIGSIVDRTPSSLFELKQQRLIAAADRKKRIIARIVSVVGLLIIILCAAIVTLTLKMAPKIDELVRSKAGGHQLVHLISRMTTTSTISSPTSNSVTSLTTFPRDNQTVINTMVDRIFSRTRRRPLI